MRLERIEKRLIDLVTAPDSEKLFVIAEALGDEIPRGRKAILGSFRALSARTCATLGTQHPEIAYALKILNTLCAAVEARLDQRYDWRLPKSKDKVLEAWPETPDRGVYLLEGMDEVTASAFLRIGDDALSFLGLADAKRYADPELTEAIKVSCGNPVVCLISAKPTASLPLEVHIGRYVFPLVKALGTTQGNYLDFVLPSPLPKFRMPSVPAVD